MQELNEKATVVRGSIQSAKEALAAPLLSSIAECVQTVVNCERVTVYMHDRANNELVTLLATGLEGTIKVPTKTGLAGLTFTSGKTVNVENAQLHRLFNPEVDLKTGFLTKQVLAVPIGQTGVLQCLNKCNMVPFSKTDEGRVAVLASLIEVFWETLGNFEGLLRNADFNELCLQAVKTAILHIGADGALHKINRFAAKLLGVAPESIVGATLSEIFRNSPGILEIIVNAVKEESTGTYRDLLLYLPGDSKDLKCLEIDMSCIVIRGLEDGVSYLLLLEPVGKPN